jgi:hypothetical protein
MIVRMTGFFAPAALRSRFLARAAAVAVALLGLLAANPAFADLKLPPRPRGDPPMRILHVTSVDPACQPNCPEWISAEGVITPGKAQEFARLINALDGRRLPILISSHGGSVRDALAMGLMIRSKGLVVAVARTLIANCPERARDCPGARGRAIVGGAFCASACPLILAGGVERLTGPLPEVGVHQITTVEKETEGVEHLTTVKKIYEQDSVDRAVQSYLQAMGVRDPVMEILRKTPAASIRWLSPAELSESHLATGALDASAPILDGGLNGLNSRPLAGGETGSDLVIGRISEPFAAPTRGGATTLEATFAYRRGGGVVGASVAAHDRDMKAIADPSPDGWTLTLTVGGGKSIQSKAGDRSQAQTIIPREQFCALARRGSLVAAPAGALAEGGPALPSVTFDLAATGGAGAIVAEACP